MALTKARAAITQVTASGQSTTLDCGAAYAATLYIRHVNGTGTITVQGTATVEARSEGGTVWFTLAVIGYGTTASAASEQVVAVPDDAGEVRIDYVAPTGSTGHTLDAELGSITAL